MSFKNTCLINLSYEFLSSFFFFFLWGNVLILARSSLRYCAARGYTSLFLCLFPELSCLRQIPHLCTTDKKSSTNDSALLLLLFNIEFWHFPFNNFNMELFPVFFFFLIFYVFLRPWYLCSSSSISFQFFQPLKHKLPHFLSCVLLPSLPFPPFNLIFLPKFLPLHTWFPEKNFGDFVFALFQSQILQN